MRLHPATGRFELEHAALPVGVTPADGLDLELQVGQQGGRIHAALERGGDGWAEIEAGPACE